MLNNYIFKFVEVRISIVKWTHIQLFHNDCKKQGFTCGYVYVGLSF